MSQHLRVAPHCNNIGLVTIMFFTKLSLSIPKSPMYTAYTRKLWHIFISYMSAGCSGGSSAPDRCRCRCCCCCWRSSIFLALMTSFSGRRAGNRQLDEIDLRTGRWADRQLRVGLPAALLSTWDDVRNRLVACEKCPERNIVTAYGYYANSDWSRDEAVNNQPVTATCSNRLYMVVQHSAVKSEFHFSLSFHFHSLFVLVDAGCSTPKRMLNWTIYTNFA